jgi:hypothetical protein
MRRWPARRPTSEARRRRGVTPLDGGVLEGNALTGGVSWWYRVMFSAAAADEWVSLKGNPGFLVVFILHRAEMVSSEK